MQYRALRFDARTACIDPESRIVIGPHDELMTSRSDVAIICDAPWTHTNQHSFFVVRRTSKTSGKTVATDVVILPPRRYPAEYSSSQIIGRKDELDAERDEFTRRLIGESFLRDGAAPRPLAEGFAISDFGLLTPPLEAVRNGLVADLVSAAVVRNTNYSGRLRIHLADLKDGDSIGHVYFGMEFERPPAPLPSPLARRMTSMSRLSGSVPGENAPLVNSASA
jgi:hypothetical protein